jgi:hypothetical protein
MNKGEKERITAMYHRLAGMGFTFQEADKMRLISMTLSRWAERECNGEIERDEITGEPMAMYETHKGQRKGFKTADREAGAIRRLKAILASHPGYSFYHQTDPRGAALYLIPSVDAAQGNEWVSCRYSQIGFCIY